MVCASKIEIEADVIALKVSTLFVLFLSRGCMSPACLLQAAREHFCFLFAQGINDVCTKF
jgi:hypothetical protein